MFKWLTRTRPVGACLDQGAVGLVDASSGRGPGFFSGLSPKTFWRAVVAPASKLTRDEAASTLFRFFRSKHVVDLRLIVVTIVGLLVVYGIFVWAVCKVNDDQKTGADLVTFVGPAVGIAGLVISWAYKTASTRLGIIDLFGCEIGTLCRVGTIFDIGTRYVREYEGKIGPKNDGTKESDWRDKYTSEEHYFPIFDNNSSKLELLEALVVCSITEFYTYMKATRDTQRRLATIPSPKEPYVPQGAIAEGETPWHAAVLNIVYLIFLSYEAGRNAIEHLVDFEPIAAENTIVIMITELTCYGFLLKRCEHDPRYPRLQLRREMYKKITPKLYRKIESFHGVINDQYWRPARELLPQLKERYEDALCEPMDQTLAKLDHAPAQMALEQAPASAAEAIAG